MTGAGIALLIAAAIAAVILQAHWRHGRQLERERRAGMHEGECTCCGFAGGHDDGCWACATCSGTGAHCVVGITVCCPTCDGTGVAA